nr:Vsp/OspC family lipoprotein [Borrelia crocidurae]
MVLVMMVMGCNSGGVSGEGTGEEGKGRKGDGSVIDLARVSKKIQDAVAFAEKVKEVQILVKSIDELSKAIAKKIKNDGTIESAGNGNKNHNGSLLAGAFQIVLTVKEKLSVLEYSDDKFIGIKDKTSDVKSKIQAFLDKLKGDNELCKHDVTDSHAQQSIDRNHATKDKGAKELGELNTAIDALLKDAKDIVEGVISELTVRSAVKE